MMKEPNVRRNVRAGDEYHKEQIRKILLNRDGHFTEEEKKRMWDVFYLQSVIEKAKAQGNKIDILRAKKNLKDYYKNETQ